MATLGRSEYLTEEYFASDYFTYLVIDEFHHAVTDQYQRIVNYFKPQFMLGLTATPERMDGKSIYEICDYNVPYEITLKEAINKGALVPFHYYGIYDETDYSTLKLVKGRYNENDLNDKYIGNVKRHDLIYKYYKKYHSKRALGFCSSRMHAEEMAKEFCRRGVKIRCCVQRFRWGIFRRKKCSNRAIKESGDKGYFLCRYVQRRCGYCFS